jgi:hypothetical protein
VCAHKIAHLADGSRQIGKPMTFDYVSNDALGGNFIAVRRNAGPWATEA